MNVKDSNNLCPKGNIDDLKKRLFESNIRQIKVPKSFELENSPKVANSDLNSKIKIQFCQIVQMMMVHKIRKLNLKQLLNIPLNKELKIWAFFPKEFWMLRK